MALINRPLTEDEARKMIAAYRAGWPKIVSLLEMIGDAEPKPHTVRYNAKFNSVTYVPPMSFYWGQGRSGPSDCEWIIPGTI